MCILEIISLVGHLRTKCSVTIHYRSRIQKPFANAAFEVTWFHSLLDEVRVKLHRPPIVWRDNSSIMSLTANLVLHARVKHVQLDLHFIRDKVLSGNLQMNYVLGRDQVVDILTKPLTIGSSAQCLDKLNVISLAVFHSSKGEILADVSKSR